jgi:hypothetical protein
MSLEFGVNNLTSWALGVIYSPGEDPVYGEFQEFEIGLLIFYISVKVYI